jgi:predicted ribosome quality control (RQC) complex YloA/Tae2 family protein
LPFFSVLFLQLRARFDSDRTRLEGHASQLAEEIAEHQLAANKYKSEAEMMQARFEQIQKEQDDLKKSTTGSRFNSPSKGMADSGAVSFDPSSSDFFAFIASSFRGDYLKVRHHVTLSHTLSQQAQMAHARQLQLSDHEEVLFSDYITKVRSTRTTDDIGRSRRVR